jgi:hypothetical protein
MIDYGMLRKHWNMAGLETFLCFKSKANFIKGKGRLSPTSPPLCHQLNPIWLPKYSKIRICSTSLALLTLG